MSAIMTASIPAISDLLRLHRCAYLTLLDLDRRANGDPSVLSVEVVEQLCDTRLCGAWLHANLESIPSELRPLDHEHEAFAALLSSFMDTSFEIERTTFDGRTVSVRLHLQPRRGTKPMEVIALAVKHTLAAAGIRLTESEATRLANRDQLRTDVAICAYVWELGRRAKGKSKGRAAHVIWRMMPLDVRKSLDEQMYWLAKTRILDAAREIVESQTR